VNQEDAQVLNWVAHVAAAAGANAAEQRARAREVERFAMTNYPDVMGDRGFLTIATDRLREITQHDAAVGNARSDFDRVREVGDYVRQRYSMATQAAPAQQARASGQDAPRPIREAASGSNRPESASAPVVDPESVNRREAVAAMAQSRGKAVEFGDNPMPSYID
jgi:hypothetical protein